MRNLSNIIDQILVVAPDLTDNLYGVKVSVDYTAPEIMWIRWKECSDILDTVAANHPRKNQIGQIFGGTSP